MEKVFKIYLILFLKSKKTQWKLIFNNNKISLGTKTISGDATEIAVNLKAIKMGSDSMLHYFKSYKIFNTIPKSKETA